MSNLGGEQRLFWPHLGSGWLGAIIKTEPAIVKGKGGGKSSARGRSQTRVNGESKEKKKAASPERTSRSVTLEWAPLLVLIIYRGVCSSIFTSGQLLDIQLVSGDVGFSSTDAKKRINYPWKYGWAQYQREGVAENPRAILWLIQTAAAWSVKSNRGEIMLGRTYDKLLYVPLHAHVG